jgi:hypothetical protein
MASSGATIGSGNGADVDAMRLATTADAPADSDFDLSSTFDVPAFLRRQEG